MYSSKSLSSKRLFATDIPLQKVTTKQNTDCGPQSQQIQLQNNSVPDCQVIFWRRSWSNCKYWRIRKFTVRLCLLATSLLVSIKSQVPKCELDMVNAMDMPK